MGLLATQSGTLTVKTENRKLSFPVLFAIVISVLASVSITQSLSEDRRIIRVDEMSDQLSQDQRMVLLNGMFTPGTDIALFKLVMIQSGLKEKPWPRSPTTPPHVAGFAAFSQWWSPTRASKGWGNTDWLTLWLLQYEVIISAAYDSQGKILSTSIGYDHHGS
jgi:hypothetical protein